MRPAHPTDAAITGLGVVTPLGFGLDATFRALGAGRAGARRLEDAPPAAACAWAAPVQPPRLRRAVPAALESQLKFLNGAGELAVEATLEAIPPGALEAAASDPERRGLYLAQVESSNWDCHEFQAAFAEATESFRVPLRAEALNRSASRRVKPFFLLESLKNNAFSFLATLLDLRGPNTSVSGFAGLVGPTLDLAARSLRHGRLDAALLVSAASVTGSVVRLELDVQGVTRARPDGPPTVVPGEGAAALLLERLETAQARGAPVRGVLLGHAAVTHAPAAGDFAPCTEALGRAAAAALEQARIETGDLLGVVLPGADAAPFAGMLASLPAAADAPRVAWQGLTGHLGLAADTVDLALGAHALATDGFPGAGPGRGRALLVLSAGLYGQAAALVVGRPRT